jgi:hypothetical protein
MTKAVSVPGEGLLTEGEVYEHLIRYRDEVREAKTSGRDNWWAEMQLKALREAAKEFLPLGTFVAYRDCLDRCWTISHRAWPRSPSSVVYCHPRNPDHC